MPQYNSLTEQTFVDIARKTRVLFNDANIPPKWHMLLFPEATMTITKLYWLQVIELDDVKVVHATQLTKHLRTWGEAATIQLKKENKVGNYS